MTHPSQKYGQTVVLQSTSMGKTSFMERDYGTFHPQCMKQD